MQVIKRTIIILIASILVVLAALPLAETEWADGLRTSFSDEGESTQIAGAIGEASESTPETGPQREGPANMSPIFRYTLPFVKELILMGIPGLLAYGILRLLKWISRLNKPPRKAAA